MKLTSGFDWRCPSFGLQWHRCYGYWTFGLWPFWLNIEYKQTPDQDLDDCG